MIKNFFRDKIFTYYFLVIIIFTAVIIIFQYNREKHYRQDQFITTMDNITGICAGYIEQNIAFPENNFEALDSLISIIPLDDLRITIINRSGSVLFDSFVENYSLMENHANRPEVRKSFNNKYGWSVRKSATTGKEYFYYAKQYNDIIIRAAAEYTIELESLLRIDKLFIIVVLSLFLLVWSALLWVHYRFKKATGQLKEFVTSTVEGQDYGRFNFPDTELGTVSHQIIDIYNDIKDKRDRLEAEQEKIFRHLQTMDEGIAIFSPAKEIVLYNDAFVNNANLLSKKPVNSPEEVLTVKAIKPVIKYINGFTKDRTYSVFDQEHFREITCERQNRYFMVRCNMFRDLSFEIIIKDITKSEKNRVMKQQLTSNIAHELRTPVTAIVGYLETLQGDMQIDPVQRKQFLTRALSQAGRLAELIQHISVINKLEEGSEYYPVDKVNVGEIFDFATDSMRARINQKNIKVNSELGEGLIIRGNRLLIHSIFQNLLENTINYAGDNITISVSMYYADDKFYYFRYYNTGQSIAEEHLNRLFERFYRVDEGRSRNSGGSGLGLAIVKHSVNFHGGQISAKNLEEGGVQFQFTISRNI